MATISMETELKIIDLLKAASDEVFKIVSELSNEHPENIPVYDYIKDIYNYKIPKEIRFCNPGCGYPMQNSYYVINVLLQINNILMKRYNDKNSYIGSIFGKASCMIGIDEVFLYLSSYSMITREWLEDMSHILQGHKVLEVMCGSGMLTKGLRDYGIDIITTNKEAQDVNDDEYSIYTNRKWIDDIEYLDAIDAIDKYGKSIDYIIMSWPPLENTIDLKVLKEMKKINQSCTLILIGEDIGGCTGSMEFFDKAVIVDDRRTTLANSRLSNRYGIHDRVMFIK